MRGLPIMKEDKVKTGSFDNVPVETLQSPQLIFDLGPTLAGAAGRYRLRRGRSEDLTKPSNRRLWAIRTKTSLRKTSFFTAAVGLINKARDPHLTWTLIPPPRLNSVLHYHT
ncbi:unnamed protein product [Pleuronectes platessa]|uniref:Uncharacterized protein n=1 Tax=Pleuronectes platessa TaxID=8262 RepID=A0A9N7V4I5_PLEPL|nr:unnamed protein product [Pleuronectes platessa]